MQGLAEAVKNLKLTDYFAKGQRAYMLGIERRDNPENSPSARTQWERGWDQKRDSFQLQMTKWKS